MSNIELLPSQNNICGMEIKDKITYKYKCPPNKFCNYAADGKLGICENTGCFPYNMNDIKINIKDYDGSGVSRNRMTNICDRKTSTDGKCGLDNNSTKCPNKKCCSIKGNCGYDKESCISISPYHSNDIIAEVNRNYFSNYIDVKDYQYEFIKQITDKYKGNNNFEISTDNKCGLDLEKEQIFKCTDNKYCDKYNNCTVDYKKFNNNNLNLNTNLNLQDLDLDLFRGEKFNDEYSKWNKKKEKIQSIYNKYINNNLEISTNENCGIDLENEKIFKCSDKQYCDKYNKCSIDYNKYIDNKIVDIDNNIFKDFINEEELKDLNPKLMDGEKFNNEYDNWKKIKKEKIQSIYNKYINNNNFEISTNGKCGIDLENEKIFKCSDKQYCDQFYNCSVNYDNNSYNNRFNFNNSNLRDLNSNIIYYTDEPLIDKALTDKLLSDNDPLRTGKPLGENDRKLKDLSSNLIHGDKFFEEYNKFRNPLDCNNIKILDTFKTLYNKKTNNNLKILDIVKTNKIDDKTCDIKYNYQGDVTGQNSRRIIFQYNPDIGYVCTNIDKEMSGLTTLDLNDKYKDEMTKQENNNITSIYIIIFISFIFLIVFIIGIVLAFMNKK